MFKRESYNTTVIQKESKDKKKRKFLKKKFCVMHLFLFVLILLSARVTHCTVSTIPAGLDLNDREALLAYIYEDKTQQEIDSLVAERETIINEYLNLLGSEGHTLTDAELADASQKLDFMRDDGISGNLAQLLLKIKLVTARDRAIA